jgi:excinuclease UvrABC nuclease subunit
MMHASRYHFSDASSLDVPKAAGFYVIHDKRVDAIVYCGRTKNLRRRLLGDHKRGNIRGSQLRKTLGRNFTLKSEDEITSYILRNCSFQFMAVEEFEEIVRLEHFAIAVSGPILNVRLKQ